MHIPRIYVDLILKKDLQLILPVDASQHILRALRLKSDDQLILFNGDGNEYLGILQAETKNLAQVLIVDCKKSNTESPLKINLIQGMARGEKMDFIIQKAVELGVTNIIPVFTEYCNVSLAGERLDKKLQHWQKVAISAAEQSGRAKIPRIWSALKLSEWLGKSQQSFVLILSPYAKFNIPAFLNKPIDLGTEISILIGPEGGFSPNEIDLVKEMGGVEAGLGPRILRTETAALVVISILQAIKGDLK